MIRILATLVAGGFLAFYGIRGLIFTRHFIKEYRRIDLIEMKMMGEEEDDLDLGSELVWEASLIRYGVPLLVGIFLIGAVNWAWL